MSIQTDFRKVTDRIIFCRRELEKAECDRLQAKYRHDAAADDLALARAALMARSDAGSNETARRAYADRHSQEERIELSAAATSLAQAEYAVVRATAQLREQEDERRYLEFVGRLMIAGVRDEAEAGELLADETFVSADGLVAA